VPRRRGADVPRCRGAGVGDCALRGSVLESIRSVGCGVTMCRYEVRRRGMVFVSFEMDGIRQHTELKEGRHSFCNSVVEFVRRFA
jgi:hypothetical protein